MILYHGSDQDEVFETLESGIDKDVCHEKENNISLSGIWMTDNKEAAQEYAQGMYTYICEVETGKIFDLEINSNEAAEWLYNNKYINISEETEVESYIKKGFDGLLELADQIGVFVQGLQNIIITRAQECGYDTVVMLDGNRGTMAKSYVVLDSSNVKILEVE